MCLSILKNRSIFLESFWVLVAQFGSAFGSLALLAILTRRLPVATYGDLSLLLTILPFFYIVVFEGIVRGLSRFYPISKSSNDTNFDSITVFTFGSAIVICILLGTLVTPPFLSFGIGHNAFDLTIFFVLAVFNALSSLLASLLNAARRRVAFSIGRIFEPLCKVGLVAVFLETSGSTVTEVGILFLLAAVLTNLLYGYFYLKFIFNSTDVRWVRISEIIGDSMFRHLLRYTWPFYTWGVFNWFRTISDRWALNYFDSTDTVGFYTATFQLAYSPMIALTIVLLNTLAPIINEIAGDGTDPVKSRQTVKITYLVSILTLVLVSALSFFVWVFKQQVGDFFLSERYIDAYVYLPVLLLAGGLFAAGSSIEVQLFSNIKINDLVLPKILLFLTGVGMNFVGAYLFSISGVVGSIFLYSALYYVWALLRSRKPFEKK